MHYLLRRTLRLCFHDPNCAHFFFSPRATGFQPGHLRNVRKDLITIQGQRTDNNVYDTGKVQNPMAITPNQITKSGKSAVQSPRLGFCSKRQKLKQTKQQKHKTNQTAKNNHRPQDKTCCYRLYKHAHSESSHFLSSIIISSGYHMQLCGVPMEVHR